MGRWRRGEQIIRRHVVVIVSYTQLSGWMKTISYNTRGVPSIHKKNLIVSIPFYSRHKCTYLPAVIKYSRKSVFFFFLRVTNQSQAAYAVGCAKYYTYRGVGIIYRRTCIIIYGSGNNSIIWYIMRSSSRENQKTDQKNRSTVTRIVRHVFSDIS